MTSFTRKSLSQHDDVIQTTQDPVEQTPQSTFQPCVHHRSFAFKDGVTASHSGRNKRRGGLMCRCRCVQIKVNRFDLTFFIRTFFSLLSLLCLFYFPLKLLFHKHYFSTIFKLNFSINVSHIHFLCFVHLFD